MDARTALAALSVGMLAAVFVVVWAMNSKVGAKRAGCPQRNGDAEEGRGGP